MINRVHKYRKQRYVLRQPAAVPSAWSDLENGYYTYCGDAVISAQEVSEFSGKRIIVRDTIQDKTVADFFKGKLLKKS